MPNYNFKKDLPIALQTEQEVASYIEQIYNAKILAFESTNKFDFLAEIQDKKVTFEVKEDFSCERTGNIGVEFSCRGKPSGIEVSQADYYVYKVHTKNYGIKYIIHKTEDIKAMIKAGKYFRIVDGGDKGSHSMNYLFKYDEFVKTGKFLPIDKK